MDKQSRRGDKVGREGEGGKRKEGGKKGGAGKGGGGRGGRGGRISFNDLLIDLHKLLPKNKWHKHIGEHELKDRLIIIGDIHGCIEEFCSLLNECGYDSDNTSVVLVGDLVRKGPQSAEVVKKARAIGALSVKGNHEVLMLARSIHVAYTGDEVTGWKRNVLHTLKEETGPKPNDYEFVNRLSDDDIQWLIDMPHTLTLPQKFGNAIIVHAGLLPGVDLHEQTPKVMQGVRNVSMREDGRYEYDSDGERWIDAYNRHHGNESLPIVYFGHDARRRFQSSRLAIGLDTGCYYGGEDSYLTAMVLEIAESGVINETRQVNSTQPRRGGPPNTGVGGEPPSAAAESPVSNDVLCSILDEDENSKIDQLCILIAEKQEELSRLREDDPNYNSLQKGIDALMQDLHHMEEVENSHGRGGRGRGRGRGGRGGGGGGRGRGRGGKAKEEPPNAGVETVFEEMQITPAPPSAAAESPVSNDALYY